MDAYKTLGAAGESYFEDRRSEFYGFAFPVATEAEALARIGEIKARFPDARHHVYAYCLREGFCTRFTDDREPQGSAGMPVLDVLRKGSIQDAVIIVVRYFGGTLLGTGGLVHAYGTAASEAVQNAGLVLCRPCRRFEVRLTYADYQKWQQISAPYEIVVEDTLFESDVCILGYVPEEDTKRLAHDVVNVTAARAFLKEKDECFASVPIS